MPEFSNNNTEAILGKLQPKQVVAFVEILQQVKLRQISFVQNIYSEQAENFLETLVFLKEVGWVNQVVDNIELIKNGLANTAEINSAIIESIINGSNRFQKCFADYLARFQNSKGMIFYQPSVSSRLELIAVRNFLLHAGVISYEAEGDKYILNQSCAHLYLWSKNFHSSTSKDDFLAAANEKNQLGTAAEIAVFEFEKNRLGQEWSERVEHTSLKNPGSCFDIKSISIIGNQISDRFIEVKAVPADSYRFFWTATEIEAAHLLKERYFLYLLPVFHEQRFDLDKMIVIQNAYNAVYQSPNVWLVEEKIVQCTLKQDT